MANELAAAAPDLSTRTARCSYFGHACRPIGIRGGAECDACRKHLRCQCEQPSSPDLAFFQHQPEKAHDAFYCGCKGWD